MTSTSLLRPFCRGLPVWLLLVTTTATTVMCEVALTSNHDNFHRRRASRRMQIAAKTVANVGDYEISRDFRRQHTAHESEQRFHGSRRLNAYDNFYQMARHDER